jgi:DNA-binding protein Fis/GNAT superfamily N-acetyltransferase
MPQISFQCRQATNAEISLTTKHLLEHTRQATGLSVEHKPFGLLAYREDACVGSAIGKIYFNWLHIDLIWVDEQYRGQGLGQNMMQQALQKAKEMGLTGIEVWTQSWQAPGFYRKLGYEEMAVLDDFTTPDRKRHVFRHYIHQPPQARIMNVTPLPELVREQVQSYFKLHGDTLPSSGVYDRLMPLFEKPLIEVTLEVTGGNQLKAANLLGINRNTLHKKITELQIDIAKHGKKPA